MSTIAPYHPIPVWRSPAGSKIGKRESVREDLGTETNPYDRIDPMPPDTHEGWGPHVLSLDDVEEFFYGYRYVLHTHHGTEAWEMVPLTLDDLMEPHLEDVVGQTYDHSLLGYLLYGILNHYLSKIPGMMVLWDVFMNWGIPGQRNVVPDILVLADVQKIPPKNIGVFDRRKYGESAPIGGGTHLEEYPVCGCQRRSQAAQQISGVSTHRGALFCDY